MRARTYTDDEIIQHINAYMDGSSHPDCVGYRAQTRERDFANKQGFIQYLRELMRFGSFQGKRILDVGCGFGWHDVGLSLLDPTLEVVGVDILPGMIEGMKECLESLGRKGVSIRVSALCGDICDLDLEPGSFGAIFSNESIEHVHDVGRMVATCHRLLGPGGKLVIVNDQNVYHRPTREQIMAMWEQREHSQKWSDFLRSIRPVEHGDAKPFVEMREDIIREANLTLEPGNARFLAEKTRGYLKADIERAARDPLSWQHLPPVPVYDSCRNPLTGEYAERLFDPFALAQQVQNAGFKVRIRHCFHRWPLRYFNGVNFRPLNRFFFSLRPPFVIIGIKT
jgi:SAM-dependent methyltransferase